MNPPKHQVTRIAAYGLILKNQKILLCRLSKHLATGAGAWTLPGGGIDFGENPESAMVREVREETGLTVKPVGLAGIDSFYEQKDLRDFHSIRIIYHTELVTQNRPNTDLKYELDGSTDFCAWWTFEEAKNLPLVELSLVGLNLAFPNLLTY